MKATPGRGAGRKGFNHRKKQKEVRNALSLALYCGIDLVTGNLKPRLRCMNCFQLLSTREFLLQNEFAIKLCDNCKRLYSWRSNKFIRLYDSYIAQLHKDFVEKMWYQELLLRGTKLKSV